MMKQTSVKDLKEYDIFFLAKPSHAGTNRWKVVSTPAVTHSHVTFAAALMRNATRHDVIRQHEFMCFDITETVQKLIK